MKTISKEYRTDIKLPKIIEKYLPSERFCVFDIETLGLNPSKQEMILAGFLEPWGDQRMKLTQYFCEHPKEEKEVLETVGTEEMREYKVDNLSMLATIYRLLGKKNSAFRDKYYEKAQLCIRDLFDIKEVRETSLYRMKLADLVSMKNELGEEEEAIELLEEWEKLHPEEGLELYFFHMCMLLKHEGNEGKVSKLYEKICQIPGATEDFRFDEIESQVLKYTKED